MAPKEGAGKLEKYAQRMSLAEEVMIRPVGPADGAADHKDVRIDVKEGATGLIMPGVAISSDNGISGRLIYEQRNFDITDWPEDFREFITMKAFRGCGQSLRIMLEPGTEFSQYSVSFTDPYFRDKPVTFELLGASWMRFRESYDEDRLKGYVALEKRRKDLWRTSVGLRAESVKVHNLDYDAPQEIRNVAGHNDVLGVRFGVGKSTVDDRFDPSKGDVFNIGCEPVVGDFTFGVLSGNYVRYYTLWEDALNRKTVLAGKIEAAKILGHAPPFEKFYAGGVSGYDIRGFEYRGVSTRGLQTNVPNPQYKDPIGSNWVFLAGAEVTVPIIEENFAGLFFVDSGTVDTGRYRISIGTGIQIKLPQLLGSVPMRFELATPLSKDELDEKQVFSFTMGGLFR
jgi:outer membrane protein insertion porin family